MRAISYNLLQSIIIHIQENQLAGQREVSLERKIKNQAIPRGHPDFCNYITKSSSKENQKSTTFSYNNLKNIRMCWYTRICWTHSRMRQSMMAIETSSTRTKTLSTRNNISKYLQTYGSRLKPQPTTNSLLRKQ